MATVYDLKPAFQRLLAPLAAGLARRNVTANQVTVAAAILSVAYGSLIATTGGAAIILLGLPAVLFVRMALNAVDGMLARRCGQESCLGFFLNEIGDVVSDTALYLPLALVVSPGDALLAGSLVVAFALTEFTGVLGLAAGGGRRYDGPFGKSDRAAFFAIVAVATALFTWPAGLPVAALLLTLGLACATIVNRLRNALPGENAHG